MLWFRKDFLKEAGVSQETALKKARLLLSRSLTSEWNFPQRVVSDPDFPVPAHVKELAALLKDVMPEAVIYGSALYNETLKRAHPSLEFVSNDIDIGMSLNDFYAIEVDLEHPKIQSMRASFTAQTGLTQNDFNVKSDVRNKALILQDRFPGIVWDSESDLSGTAAKDSYDNIHGSFSGSWADSTGKIHKLQFNVTSNYQSNHFVHGDAVLTSVAMKIGDSSVSRYTEQPEHAAKLLYSSTMHVGAARADERFAELQTRLPGLKNIGDYARLPEVKAQAEALHAQSEVLQKIQNKINAGKKLTAAEAAPILEAA